MAKTHQDFSKRPRDEEGHFIEESHKTSGATDLISKFVKTGKPEDEETLVDLKITNPLHRITQILQDIKNHQSTSFGFKVSVPLIALPVFLLILFQSGRAQIACTQAFSSKIGTIKNIQILAPKKEESLKDNLLNIFSFIPFIPKKQTQFIPQDLTLLINSQNEPYSIINEKSIDLKPLENEAVILTGTVSDCAHTITLNSPQNLSVIK